MTLVKTVLWRGSSRLDQYKLQNIFAKTVFCSFLVIFSWLWVLSRKFLVEELQKIISVYQTTWTDNLIKIVYKPWSTCLPLFFDGFPNWATTLRSLRSCTSWSPASLLLATACCCRWRASTSSLKTTVWWVWGPSTCGRIARDVDISIVPLYTRRSSTNNCTQRKTNNLILFRCFKIFFSTHSEVFDASWRCFTVVPYLEHWDLHRFVKNYVNAVQNAWNHTSHLIVS